MTHLFCSLDSKKMAKFLQTAQRFICYAGPGLQMEPALAMAEAAKRIGVERVTVTLDFTEQVLRMGFGDLKAVKVLRNSGIKVRDSQGLRMGLVLVDDEGFQFTPTALYLEAESQDQKAANAMRLSREQLREAQARLSPLTKEIAAGQTHTLAERKRIEDLPIELNTKPISEEMVVQVEKNLESAPPVPFDLTRQVRVFNAYLQYVELKLTGAAIQRHRLTIPRRIQRLGGSQNLEKRLRTTFELIEKNNKLSSKNLDKELNGIRKDFTRSLGKEHGRVILKAEKKNFEKRLKSFQRVLGKHQRNVSRELQSYLNKSRRQILAYYLPRVIDHPPETLIFGVFEGFPTRNDCRKWLERELFLAFPSANELLQNMKLELRYKDITYETLNRPDFLCVVKKAFPSIDWNKTYAEFRAAGETTR